MKSPTPAERDAPEEIHGVTGSMFSVARYYGGITAYSCRYVYDPIRDVLVRVDVLKRREDERRKCMRKQKQEQKDKQEKLF
jgi:hypothetical protein